MGFSNLTNAWTVLFPLAVLLYYFFRKRYETKTISSTLFWEQSMRETKVSPYLKELQRNALFYLQMAALLLLFFLLLGPFIIKEEVSSSQTIIVVDTSASMLAVEDGEVLFEKNKDAMRTLTLNRDGQPITIVKTGKEPSIVIRDETDRAVVAAAIDNLAITYEHESMGRTIEFVQSISSEGGADVHIFTDSLDRLSIPESNNSISWTVKNAEGTTNNVSIDKFGAIKTATGVEAIIKVANQSNDNMQGRVRITDALTGAILAEDELSVERDADLLLSFKDLPHSKMISAELILNDDYETDNTAFFLIGNETSEVVIDGQLHELVKKAFEAIEMYVTTGSVAELAKAQEASIIVTNDNSFLERGTKPIILIGRNDSVTELTSGEVTSTADSLFTIADISDLYVSEVYPPFEGFTTIASVGDKPFIQKSERGDIVILSDIELTDWPLHASFPLFIWSATEQFRIGSDTLGTFIPNERRAVIANGTSNGIDIFTLDDEYVTTFEDGSKFIAPSRPGIYKAREDKLEKMLSVHLEDAEKEIAKGTSFKIGRNETVQGEVLGKSMIGPLLIVPILLLLLIEWEVQRRRGYPN